MSETNTASPFMTTKQLAAYLGITTNAVGLMRHKGTGPIGTRIGNTVRYRKTDVDTWLQAKAEADHIARRAAA